MVTFTLCRALAVGGTALLARSCTDGETIEENDEDRRAENREESREDTVV